MKRRMFSVVVATLFVSSTLGTAVFAQDNLQNGPAVYYGPAVNIDQALQESAAGQTLPMWQRPVRSFSTYSYKDGKYHDDGSGNSANFTVTMLGADPIKNKLTTIPITIVPLVVTFKLNGTNYTYDPTKKPTGAGCAAGVPFDLTTNSPLFVDTQIGGMNGYWNIFYDNPNAKTQFTDAQMRAEFYSWMPAETPWHNKFPSPPTIAPKQPLVADGHVRLAKTANRTCQPLASLDYPWLDGMLQTFASAFGTNQLVLFVTYDVIEYDNPDSDFLGYHSAFGNPPQVYAIAAFDDTQTYQAKDVSVVAHELGETTNNPLVSNGGGNQAPPWTLAGANYRGCPKGCQCNFEVGDPRGILSSNHAVTANGFTYHFQELAFAGWFYRIAGLGIADPGNANPYSTNGTFRSDAGALCTP